MLKFPLIVFLEEAFLDFFLHLNQSPPYLIVCGAKPVSEIFLVLTQE